MASLTSGEGGGYLYAALDIQVIPYNGQMYCALEIMCEGHLEEAG